MSYTFKVPIPENHVLEITSDNNDTTLFDVRRVVSVHKHAATGRVEVVLDGNVRVNVDVPHPDLIRIIAAMMVRAGSLE